MTQHHRDKPDLQLLEFVSRATVLLLGSGEPTGLSPVLTPLAGDGSRRRIYRVHRAGLRTVAVANPLPADRVHPDENEAFLAVREYLHRRNIRVPRFYAADLGRGFLLLEDLGDERLSDRVEAEDWRDTYVLYKQAVQILVRMQAPGTPGYRADWTSNPAYTEDFIVEQEAGYFHRELALGAAESAEPFAGIEPECRRLAGLALGAETAGTRGVSESVFMHRDFQSRNLMVSLEGLAVIDFQGARLGPPGYDLAALLCDPYVHLPAQHRDEFVALYRQEAGRAGVRAVVEMTADGWRAHFLANAANRLMQALGAFAKLGIHEGRPGFSEHVPAGLALLAEILDALGETPRLRRLVRELQDRSWNSGASDGIEGRD
ncbi:MAG: phosphotransferase [Candidatus Eisenbacteria sp.]|nr:phosphotransferase [Candidatus Eisenbacteria bacterium]